jgi:hypothetical protein
MDALMQIRAKINAFPGYASEDDIRRSDEFIRAYVGERLSELQERLGDGSAADSLEPLIERSAFANQRALRPLEEPNLHLEVPALFDADLALLEAADRATSVAPAGVGAFCASLTEAFDARDAAMSAIVPPPA